MRILLLFLPKKLYQWTLLFYVSVPFFVGLMLTVLPIVNVLLETIGLKVETQTLLVTVLFLYAVVFLWQTLFRLFLVFKQKTPVTLKQGFLNTSLFVISLPIVVVYLLFGVTVMWTYAEPVMTDMWRDSMYKRLSYQPVDEFPSAHCAGYSVNTPEKDIALAITTQQEYQAFTVKSDQACGRFGYPTIDFTHQQLLISTISYRGCKTVQRRMYQDDKNKRILHITTIRSIRLVGCISEENSNTEAEVIPKVPGFTVEFQTHRPKPPGFAVEFQAHRERT